MAELSRELATSDFGVICLAPDNLASPWLNYEAGAISKSVESRACPVLLGVDKSEVPSPMSQLQLTSTDHDDIYLLMQSMNKAAGEPLTLVALRESVEMWWPKLESAISAIDAPAGDVASASNAEPKQPEPTVEEMLAELLHRVRDVDSRMQRLERPVESPGRQLSFEFEDDRKRQSLLGLVMPVARRHGMSIEKISRSGKDVVIELEKPLPDHLTRDAYAEIGALAQKIRGELQLKAPNRTVVFDEAGFPDESPF